MNRSGHGYHWAAVATTVTAATALFVPGNGFASAATVAPAVNGAAAGGPVIVVLTDQHPALGTVSNIQHVEVADPTPGKWTAVIKWANGRAHLQSPPNVPGTYTGDISFRTTGQRYVTSFAAAPVFVPARSSVTVPVRVTMPSAPGDHPESVRFVASNGARTSLPVVRRTLVPSAGGTFTTTITSSVGRGVGQISTYDLDVPQGKPALSVSFHTADASADNRLTFYLIDPNGTVVARASTPTTNSGGQPVADATLTAANPVAGRWEIDVELNLTTSGKEFTQTVDGSAGYVSPSA